jgi:CheY-like chemotaxis protein
MEIQSGTLIGKRILLVEDERSTRESLGQLLLLDDHIVVEANNGAEALGLFARDRFDVVLTDYLLPFLKGTELSGRIKDLAPDQPILMITGQGLRPGRHNRVDAVLRKPFDLGKLRSALVEVMKAKKSHPIARNDSER